MPLFDVYLDSISMAAMIIIIGIIVDDGIIIAENIQRHRENGATPLDAAVNGLHEVFTPVITGISIEIMSCIRRNIKGIIHKVIGRNYIIRATT